MAGISFSAGELADEIKQRIPAFTIDFKPDFRQAIADSWPASIDDQSAKEDWGLSVHYDLQKMTDLMLEKVREKLNR
jgi:hypothetical protein